MGRRRPIAACRTAAERTVPRRLVVAVVVAVLLVPGASSLAHDVLLETEGRWVHHHTRTYTVCNLIDQIDNPGLRQQASQARQAWHHAGTVLQFPVANTCVVEASGYTPAEIEFRANRWGDTGWYVLVEKGYHRERSKVRFNLDELGARVTAEMRQALGCRAIGEIVGVQAVARTSRAAEGVSNDCMSFMSAGQPASTYSDVPGQHSIQLVDETYAWHDEPVGDNQLHGVQVHPFWADSERDFDGNGVNDMLQELELVRSSGADAVRVDLGWASLQPHGPGPFDSGLVDRVERFLTAAEGSADTTADDVEVIVTLTDSPCWASSAPEALKLECQGSWWERGVQRYAPADPSDYARAAAEVAKRWGSRIKALELWNEPNETSFFRTMEDTPEARATRYAAMVKTSYPLIKQAQNDLVVLGGALAPGSGGDSHYRFLDTLYGEGIEGHYDALSYHAYGDGRDPDLPVADDLAPSHHLVEGTKLLRETMANHGESGKNLWITEFGFASCPLGQAAFCVGETAQAEYTDDNYRIARRFPFVRAAITYQARDRGLRGDLFGDDTWGLVRRNFTEKPALTDFRSAMDAYSAPPR